MNRFVPGIVMLMIASSAPAEQAGPLRYSEPTFTLTLDASQYDALQRAAVNGVARYGGDVAFRVHLFDKRAAPRLAAGSTVDGLEWIVTLDGQRTVDVWTSWSAEQTAAMLARVNVDKLDERTKSSLKSLQALNLKLDQARNNPSWPIIATEAVIGKKNTIVPSIASAGQIVGEAYTVSVGADAVDVAEQSAVVLDGLVGKRAIVKGYMKSPDKFELVSAIAVRENCLDLVVMSECPFGTKAADAIIQFVKERGSSKSDSGSPGVEMRYLFYKRDQQRTDGSTVSTWWALHGESEIAENLVQMIIRDDYPSRLYDYIQKRAAAPSSGWRELAARVGLSQSDVDSIQGRMTNDRDQLIATEYAFVNGVLGVTDGSPTFVWEGRPVKDLSRVAAFKSLDLNKGSCGGESH